MSTTDERPVETASTPARVSRRSVLTVGAVGIGTAALAACSQAKSPDRSAAGATDPNSAAPGASSSAATAPSSAAAGGASLAKLSSIKVGEAIAATGADGSKIIISRPTATTVAAFSAICTHQGCTVAPAGKELDCPCHGSVYNATTGAVINGPAPRPLPAVSVKLSGDDVVAG
jgi:cytochrome b6-f complex iron-sulfur subunit